MNSVMRFLADSRLRRATAGHALRGPLGTPVDIDAIAKDLPWRRIGVDALMPLTRHVRSRCLFAIMGLDILLAILWPLRIVDFVCELSSRLLRPIVELVPVYDRMQIPATVVGGRSAETVRAYWATSIGVFLACNAIVVVVTATEFSLNPRVTTAIAYTSVRRNGFGMTVNVFAATLFVMVANYLVFYVEIAQFAAWTYGVYGSSPKSVIAGGMLAAGVHAVGLFSLWGFLIGWLSVMVRLSETVARILRRHLRSSTV